MSISFGYSYSSIPGSALSYRTLARDHCLHPGRAANPALLEKQRCKAVRSLNISQCKTLSLQTFSYGGTEARSLTDLGCRRSIGHREEHGSCTRSCVGCPVRKDGEYTFNTWIRTRILSTEHDFGEFMRSILQSASKQKQSREQKQRQRERQHEAIGNSSPGWLPLFGP